jgi:hypothetical protein
MLGARPRVRFDNRGNGAISITVLATEERWLPDYLMDGTYELKLITIELSEAIRGIPGSGLGLQYQ